METNVVSFKDKSGKEYRVVVGEETAIARLRRANLRTEGVQAKEEDPDRKILRVVFYPDCVASVTDWCGMFKPSFEEFEQLPGKFVDDWAAAVWKNIPQWEPGYAVPETEEDAKKPLS